jgi:hypothetical protein
MSKFLLIQPQLKYLVIFFISELMFFGPKKEVPPWREVLFHRKYLAAARKGLTYCPIYLVNRHDCHIILVQ